MIKLKKIFILISILTISGAVLASSGSSGGSSGSTGSTGGTSGSTNSITGSTGSGSSINNSGTNTSNTTNTNNHGMSANGTNPACDPSKSDCNTITNPSDKSLSTPSGATSNPEK